jgi:hypothetical protein
MDPEVLSVPRQAFPGLRAPSPPPSASGPRQPTDLSRSPSQLSIHTLFSRLALRLLSGLLQLLASCPLSTGHVSPLIALKVQAPPRRPRYPPCPNAGPPTAALVLPNSAFKLVPSRSQSRPQSPCGSPSPIRPPTLATHPSVPGR